MLRSLFEFAPMPLPFWTVPGGIMRVNAQAERMFVERQRADHFACSAGVYTADTALKPTT
jgi:hypothetical protein